MGVPVAIKDIFAVDGMPTTAGSKLDVADLIGPEGPFVQALRRAGCVILGKVKTVEFALGALGISTPQGTPWNPWDAATQRIPGGSSSGPAVAVAAGLCGFAIGSDTGGSVRLPACFCGTFGHKTSVGLWPTAGVFPLSGALDTIGPLTASAADAALVFAALTGQPVPQPAPAGGLRLGRPTSYFFEHLDDTVAACTERALAALREAGATIAPARPARGARARGLLPGHAAGGADRDARARALRQGPRRDGPGGRRPRRSRPRGPGRGLRSGSSAAAASSAGALPCASLASTASSRRPRRSCRRRWRSSPIRPPGSSSRSRSPRTASPATCSTCAAPRPRSRVRTRRCRSACRSSARRSTTPGRSRSR